MHDPIPPQILNNFCVLRDFIRLPKLISKFQYNNGYELKTKLREFLDKTQHATHANHIKTCMERENILCVRLSSSKPQDNHTTVIIYYTGASFGLTRFKSCFIDYVICNIPVKDVKNSIPSLGLEQQFKSLLMQMENMYSYFGFLIISQLRMCNFPLHKPIISFMVSAPSLNVSMFKWYLRTMKFS